MGQKQVLYLWVVLRRQRRASGGHSCKGLTVSFSRGSCLPYWIWTDHITSNVCSGFVKPGGGGGGGVGFRHGIKSLQSVRLAWLFCGGSGVSLVECLPWTDRQCLLLCEDDFARFAGLCVQSKFTRASCTSFPDVVTPLSTLLPPIPNSIPLRGQVKGTKYPVFTLCCALKSPAPEARLLSPGSRAQLGRQQGGGLRGRTAAAFSP